MPQPAPTREEMLDLSPASFQRFARFITARLGIKMPEAKATLLQNRLLRRLHALGLSSIDEYQNYLFDPEHQDAELAAFIDAITTNKTDFFREPAHFDYLRDTALPALDPDPRRPWNCKVWCAGCSSGEEVYTLAMVLAEFGRARGQFDFALLATDISTRVLTHAREAIYGEERIAPVPPGLRSHYFLRSRDRASPKVRVVPELRSRVHFHRLNFMDADYPVRDTFDVIFFRNVMIYFDRPTQQDVVGKLARNLRPGGFIFVGHSESLLGLTLPVQLVESAVYRK